MWSPTVVRTLSFSPFQVSKTDSSTVTGWCGTTDTSHSGRLARA